MQDLFLGGLSLLLRALKATPLTISEGDPDVQRVRILAGELTRPGGCVCGCGCGGGAAMKPGGPTTAAATAGSCCLLILLQLLCHHTALMAALQCCLGGTSAQGRGPVCASPTG